MEHPTFDKDGYPTEETLEAVRTWPATDPAGLMDFVEEATSDYGEVTRERQTLSDASDEITVRYSTGGWSGNENLIGALQDNLAFWMLCWYESRRGGGYTFRIPVLAEGVCKTCGGDGCGDCMSDEDPSKDGIDSL